MKYKGFVIEPVYFAGSDFTIKNGIVKPRKQTKKDIEYYNIIDPTEDEFRHGAEFTIAECKQRIDGLLSSLGWKRNKETV